MLISFGHERGGEAKTLTRRDERRVAIVTGSATGIGAACAEELARQGVDVVVNYARSDGLANEVAERCRNCSVDSIAVQGDVSEDEACRDIVNAALSRWGRLDILVNNAGTTVFADASDLKALTATDFERIFAVNVTGAYQMTRAAEPALRRSPLGSVVNISSHAGFSGVGSSSAYAASKGALNTLTLSLARALAPDVRVNAVCPGFVDTGWMSRKLDDESLAAFKKRSAAISPLKRLVSPAEVAEAVSWFALGGPSITGQLLVIDAGTHLAVGNPL